MVGGGVYYSSINLHAKKEGMKSLISPLLLQFQDSVLLNIKKIIKENSQKTSMT